jgi:hypothetical protein
MTSNTHDDDADDAADWEAVARKELGSKVERRADEASAAAWKVAAAFENDALTYEEVNRYRHAMEALIYCVEDDVLGRTDEFDAFGGGIPFVGNTGDAADYLGITVDAVNEIDNGATLELDNLDADELRAGNSVVATTPAGIEVRVAPPAGHGETNPGP